MPGALPLAAASLFGSLWLLGIALEAAAVALATKIAWHEFQAVLQLPATTATTCFALEYTSPGRWLTRRNLVLLAIPSLVSLLIVLNDSQFVWSRLELDPDGMVVTSYTAPGAFMVAFGMGLVLINTAAFLWLFVRSPQHRWPVALMLFGEIAARGLYSFDYVNRPSQPAFDPIIAAILLVWSMYAIALFGFHILDPLPAARRTVIEQMGAGVVVFDAGWRVVSLNPAAETILGVRSGAARGKTWQQLALPGEILPPSPIRACTPPARQGPRARPAAEALR